MTFEEMIKERPEDVRNTAFRLRKYVVETLPNVDENIYGGKKVQNALYSKESANRVVCGIQANDNFCMLYLHKTDEVNTDSLKLEGKGKHAKHVKFKSPNEVDGLNLSKILESIYQIS